MVIATVSLCIACAGGRTAFKVGKRKTFWKDFWDFIRRGSG
jgi:hypothetical protein